MKLFDVNIEEISLQKYLRICRTRINSMVEELKEHMSKNEDNPLMSNSKDIKIADDMSQLVYFNAQLLKIESETIKIRNEHGLW